MSSTASRRVCRGPTPKTRQLYLGLHGNQAATNRFIGALMGSVPIREFFSKENIDRFIGA